MKRTRVRRRRARNTTRCRRKDKSRKTRKWGGKVVPVNPRLNGAPVIMLSGLNAGDDTVIPNFDDIKVPKSRFQNREEATRQYEGKPLRHEDDGTIIKQPPSTRK